MPRPRVRGHNVRWCHILFWIGRVRPALPVAAATVGVCVARIVQVGAQRDVALGDGAAAANVLRALGVQYVLLRRDLDTSWCIRYPEAYEEAALRTGHLEPAIAVMKEAVQHGSISGKAARHFRGALADAFAHFGGPICCEPGGAFGAGSKRPCVTVPLAVVSPGT